MRMTTMVKPYTSMVFICSLLGAYLLYFYPLRGELTYWRPMLVFLVVIFWLLVEPHVIGVGFAWCAGLLLDTLASAPLGQNALAMGIAAYLLQLAGPRMKNYSVWHQLVVVAALAMFYQLVVIVVGLVVGKAADNWFMLYPVISTVLIWPLLAISLWKLYEPD